MGKLWLVAKQEYVGRVRQRSFLVGTLSILAIIAVVMGIIAIIVIGGRDDRPLGYVDLAGLFAAQPAPAVDGPELRAFADEAAARRSTRSRRDPGLLCAARGLSEPPRGGAGLREGAAERAHPRRLRRRAADGPRGDCPRWARRAAGVRQRLVEGTLVTLRSLDGRRQIDPSSVDALLPFLAGFLFIMATVSSSGYLLQALTAEKENRRLR